MLRAATCASVRVRTGLVKLELSKYSPLRPLPAAPMTMPTVAGSEVVSVSAVRKVNWSGPV